MLNTSMIRKAFCCATNKVGLLLVLAALCFFGNAASLWGESVQRSVFLQRGPLPAQADPIPNHLWQQAMAYGQPINYQPQLGADASESVQPESMEGEVIEDFTDGSLTEDAFDPYGLVRVWANGVPTRVITAQRYSDAYWRFNIDLLSLERSGPRETITTTGTPSVPVDIFRRAAPTGGMRISASADLFYSFDLEFAWLGNITWVGRPSNQFKWNTVNGGRGHIYNIGPLVAATNGVLIATRSNKTNFGSNLNAFEINTRFRWVGTTSPFTGAWILGARYVRFTESAYVDDKAGPLVVQSSLGGPTNVVSSVRTDADNNLVGFQGGGEWFWSVFRGVMIGGNLKGGIYGNLAQTHSAIHNVTGPGGSNLGNAEYNSSSTTAAFFGEANVMVNAHLGHNWYIRGGYTGLFLTNVSSAVSAVQEDFQTVSTKNSLIANGFYGGLEWKY